MSDDPETARQIAELSLDTRPLLVLDVDDVLLEFIRPFVRYLDGEGYSLKFDSFRLNGNVRHALTDEPADEALVGEFVSRFFDAQADWQTLTDGAADALESLAGDVEIVLLTAMPHRHREFRRQHLLNIGLPYPVVTTEAAKGPAIASLRGISGRPVAFVDDMPHNLVSARKSLPDSHLFNMMAMPDLRKLLPPVPEDVIVVDNWSLAAPMIAEKLGVRWRGMPALSVVKTA
jgi:hypothetical protein